ncbi:unannotated protein [freshwater metagenome]|uniref:Unannotated protein n=1 Tax=freshwater metagenome TaxID=449393 RepID=A0A6J7NAG3_9ZZZZ
MKVSLNDALYDETIRCGIKEILIDIALWVYNHSLSGLFVSDQVARVRKAP